MNKRMLVLFTKYIRLHLIVHILGSSRLLCISLKLRVWVLRFFNRAWTVEVTCSPEA